MPSISINDRSLYPILYAWSCHCPTEGTLHIHYWNIINDYAISNLVQNIPQQEDQLPVFLPGRQESSDLILKHEI